MTLSMINSQFMLHRSVCKVCASNGAAVCEIGLEVLRLYQIELSSTDPLEVEEVFLPCA